MDVYTYWSENTEGLWKKNATSEIRPTVCGAFSDVGKGKRSGYFIQTAAK